MKLNLLRTCVTPARSILNRFRDQLPVEIARTKPEVMWSPWNCMVLNASNSFVRDGFLRTLSIAAFRFALKVLNRSSNKRANSWPALKTTYGWQSSNKTSRGHAQLKSFVANVIAIINHLLIVHCHQDTTCHGCHEDCFGSEVHSDDRNMSQNDRSESF